VPLAVATALWEIDFSFGVARKAWFGEPLDVKL
jgi:hypothetical protein